MTFTTFVYLWGNAGNVPKVFYLIDDDEDEHYLFALALSEIDPSFIVKGHADATAAVLELASTNDIPDYIFLDINMPRINGWQCLQQLREVRALTEIPIAMYSTSCMESDRLTSEHLALASVYMNKKNSIPELVTSLQVFLAQFP